VKFNIKIERFTKTTLGEGPLWDFRDNTLYYIDIEGKYIKKCDVKNQTEHVICLPQKVGAIALCNDDTRILAAMEDGIYYVDETNCTLAHPKIDIKGFRFNDGKVGPNGCFYVGTMSEEKKGAFYKLDANGNLTELFDGVGISNGLDWSSDNKTMYYIDTVNKQIDAFDFDMNSGNVVNRRCIIQLNKDENPDGMCSDNMGYLNIALWGAGKMIIINPLTQQRIGEIRLPASQITCPVFGGENMDTLYITSALINQWHNAQEQCAGKLFSVKMPYKGKRINLFG